MFVMETCFLCSRNWMFSYCLNEFRLRNFKDIELQNFLVYIILFFICGSLFVFVTSEYGSISNLNLCYISAYCFLSSLYVYFSLFQVSWCSCKFLRCELRWLLEKQVRLLSVFLSWNLLFSCTDFLNIMRSFCFLMPHTNHRRKKQIIDKLPRLMKNEWRLFARDRNLTFPLETCLYLFHHCITQACVFKRICVHSVFIELDLLARGEYAVDWVLHIRRRRAQELYTEVSSLCSFERTISDGPSVDVWCKESRRQKSSPEILIWPFETQW
jgi:hypothetical protein